MDSLHLLQTTCHQEIDTLRNNANVIRGHLDELTTISATRCNEGQTLRNDVDDTKTLLNKLRTNLAVVRDTEKVTRELIDDLDATGAMVSSTAHNAKKTLD